MKVSHRMMLYAALLTPFALTWACRDDEPTSPTVPAEVETLRASLAPFASLARAKSDGYATAITDCMSNGDVGAMGVHFGNTALIDATVNPLRPEVLIYEPGASGEMSLVGVEFIIPFAAVPKTAPAPELFGEKFIADDAFGLWGLHVWTHRTNPSGLFSPWNPRVRCS
jgi:hypothetical protein